MSQPVYTREGARDLDRAAVETAKAHAELVRLQVEKQRALDQAELRRVETQQTAHDAKAQAEARTAERERNRGSRAQQRATRREWFGEYRDLIMTLIVIVSSMGIAWPAQAVYFVGAGMGWMGLAVPLVVEGPQWLAAALGGRAVKVGASPQLFWFYQAATWIFAAVAAAINYAHGSQRSVLLGVIYALASLTGMIAWELYVLSSKSHATDQTPEERRRNRARHKSFPLEWDEAQKLRHAVTGLDSEAAWSMAWRSLHGAGPGVTAPILQRQNDALAAVGQAIGSPVDAADSGELLARSAYSAQAAQRQLEASGWVFPDTAPDALIALNLSPTAPVERDEPPNAQGTVNTIAKPQVASFKPPVRRAPRERSKAAQSPGARRAAAHSARKAQSDPRAASAERERAAATYRELKASGQWVSFKALGETFGMSAAWAHSAVRDFASPTTKTRAK